MWIPLEVMVIILLVLITLLLSLIFNVFDLYTYILFAMGALMGIVFLWLTIYWLSAIFIVCSATFFITLKLYRNMKEH